MLDLLAVGDVLLDVREGEELFASWKATATRLVPL